MTEGNQRRRLLGSHDGGDPRDTLNLGIYRLQVAGSNTTLMRWLHHRGGAQHFGRWKQERTDAFPAAAVLGADPGVILAAVTPVPDPSPRPTRLRLRVEPLADFKFAKSIGKTSNLINLFPS